MKLLITAGPTREFLDPVRFLSNRSTGKMGYAIAAAGINRGYSVHLISGPVSLPPPAGVTLSRVMSAAEMLDAVINALPACDALIMCAAVSDWRPRQRFIQKLKKNTMCTVLELERTADILQAVAQRRRLGQIIIGFAAETENVTEAASEKRLQKGLDLIVANDVSRPDAGFESDTNAVSFISNEGIETLPVMPKIQIANRLLTRLENIGKEALQKR